MGDAEGAPPPPPKMLEVRWLVLPYAPVSPARPAGAGAAAGGAGAPPAACVGSRKGFTSRLICSADAPLETGGT